MARTGKSFPIAQEYLYAFCKQQQIVRNCISKHRQRPFCPEQEYLYDSRLIILTYNYAASHKKICLKLIFDCF